MTTFPSPELVSAVMSDRRREADERGLARAARLARERCIRAASPLRARLLRRGRSDC